MAVERVFPASPTAIAGAGLVASAFPYYTTGAEQLRVTLVTVQPSASVFTTIRYWDEALGQVQVSSEQFVTLGSSTVREYILPRGALLNLRLATAPSVVGPNYTQFFARVEMIRGAPGGARTVITTILQGYVAPGVDRCWPGSPIGSMEDGLGFVHDEDWTVTAGPLQAEIVVPTGVRWQVVSGQLFVITDATVATRQVSLQILNASATRVWEGVGVTDQTASLTKGYSLAPGLQPNSIDVANKRFLPVPGDLFLTRFDTFRVSVSNAQAGDSIVPGVLRLRKWLAE